MGNVERADPSGRRSGVSLTIAISGKRHEWRAFTMSTAQVGGRDLSLEPCGQIELSGTPVTTDDAGGPLKPYTKPQPQPGDNGVVKP